MPGFITVTKCLLFNHIICQLLGRLRQVYVTQTQHRDHRSCLLAAAAPHTLWDVPAVPRRGSAPESGTTQLLFLLILLLCFTYSFPFTVWTQSVHPVRGNRASAIRYHMERGFLSAFHVLM